MHHILQNRIFTHYLLGLFFVVIFLAPFSFSPSELIQSQKPFLTHIAYAQENVSGWSFLNNPGLALGNLILNIASSFTWLGGSLFDAVFTNVVFGMGGQMSGPLGSAVDVTWKIIRDICNLAFIFGFIYIGIRTILDPDNSSTKRMLAQVIIGALLINFSLFFSKVIIDFSNFTAVQIYNTLTVGGGSISESVANSLGIISFYKAPDPASLAKITDGGKVWFFFMAALFLFVSAFVFLAAAILLIVRFVALILIMVFSPLLFAATVFPGTQGIASKLWKQLISHSFFAPAYLLLVLVSLTLIQGLSLMKGGDGFANLTKTGGINASGDALSVVLQFFIVIFFMIAALMIAREMGIQGGQMAINVGNNLRSRGQQFLGGATFGLGAKVGRATVGRVAQGISERDGLKDAAARRGIGGWAARRVLTGSRAVGDASFDARNIAGAGKTLGIGEGRKGGYKTVLGEIEEKETKFAKSLGEVSDDDVRVEGRKKEMESLEKQLRVKRDERTSTNDPVKKATLATEIREIEEKQKKAQMLYQQEKQRRIIGSTYTTAGDDSNVESLKMDYDTQKKNLEKTWKEYSEMTDEEEREITRGALETLKEQVKKSKKAYESAVSGLSEQGYASVLEKSNLFTAWPVGRLIAQEREVGESIRKAYEKKIKKTKEDARHEELVSKLDKK